ncbi:acyltransferase [Devosia sp. J2-20]|jgi:UDP-2-acetamido-3-amino-2,3-dideoxy-glucuronate N-acetyltransferase|uniref:acyltransferase n=1 Tax=unclassified Devosia TaxID=196773 RepID=UPI00249B6B80|nr:acyltransferase [Devosia sp. J2-20]WDR00465.1 acyltransferase [Devosia sp. J2-20]|tara:strand:+ start:2672 stop:3136 length:465 start_codon:yes stop_codon:yes gene_type:complete
MTNSRVPTSTKVWQHVVILPDAIIGENCNICSHVFIENDVVVGDDVTIKNGCLIYDGVRIARGAFIGPGVVFTNDRYPRARGYDTERAIVFEPTVVEEGVAIGANSTIICGVTIGKDAMIGAGSVVTRDIPAGAKAFGNPARVVGRAPDSERSR